jgi:hypothetical protein
MSEIMTAEVKAMMAFSSLVDFYPDFSYLPGASLHTGLCQAGLTNNFLLFSTELLWSRINWR